LAKFSGKKKLHRQTVWRKKTVQTRGEIVKIQMESLVPTLPKITKVKRF
jgi:hypothetical protein